MNSILITTSWPEVDVRSKANWAAELAERGYEVTVVTLDDRGTEIAHNYVEDVVQLRLPDTPSLSPKELETKWEIPSLRFLYGTEREYFVLDEAQARNRTLRIAKAVAELFENRDFDLVYQGRGGEIHRLLIHYVAKNHGSMTVWGEFSPFDNSVAFGTGLDGTWGNYRTIPYEQIPENAREETRQFITDFKEQKQFYSHGNDGSSLILPENPIRTFREVYERFVSDQPLNPVRGMKRKVRKSISNRINERLVPSVEESIRLTNNHEYVYFPLQYPVESRLTLFSPQCYDQRSIINYLSRILPTDVQLLVKQHPNHPGHQSPLWIRSVDQLSNVDIVSPSVNSHDLIQSAAAVVVTNNTVGFEALFYETPLVVLGAAFYMNTPAAQRVNDYGTLPQQLAKAIQTETTEAEMVSSIYSLRQASFAVSGEVGAEQRAREVSDAIVEFVADVYE